MQGHLASGPRIGSGAYPRRQNLGSKQKKRARRARSSVSPTPDFGRTEHAQRPTPASRASGIGDPSEDFGPSGLGLRGCSVSAAAGNCHARRRLLARPAPPCQWAFSESHLPPAPVVSDPSPGLTDYVLVAAVSVISATSTMDFPSSLAQLQRAQH